MNCGRRKPTKRDRRSLYIDAEYSDAYSDFHAIYRNVVLYP